MLTCPPSVINYHDVIGFNFSKAKFFAGEVCSISKQHYPENTYQPWLWIIEIEMAGGKHVTGMFSDRDRILLLARADKDSLAVTRNYRHNWAAFRIVELDSLPAFPFDLTPSPVQPQKEPEP
jgi:hypothetical protein